MDAPEDAVTWFSFGGVQNDRGSASAEPLLRCLRGFESMELSYASDVEEPEKLDNSGGETEVAICA
jgi:hypothetical protein